MMTSVSEPGMHAHPVLSLNALRFWLLRSRVSSRAAPVIATMSILISLIYLMSTFVTDSVNAWLDLVLLVLLSAVAVHVLIELILAPSALRHLVSPRGIVDVLSVSALATLPQGAMMIIWLRLLRALVMFRLLDAMFFIRFVHKDIERQLFRIATVIVSILLISSALIEVVENWEPWYPDNIEVPPSHIPRLDLTNAFYLVTVTLTTIGYGDVVPITALGKIIVLVMVATAFLLIPRETNKLVTLLTTQTMYGRMVFRPTSAASHIVVCIPVGIRPDASAESNAASAAVTAFLHEFFNDDHGQSLTHAVILGRGSPSPELTVFLAHPKFSRIVTYIDGDVMLQKDLHRAAASTAKAIFVFCNKLSHDVDTEDSNNILRSLAIQKFVTMFTQKPPKLFVQLLRPENRVLFVSSIIAWQKSKPNDTISGVSRANTGAKSTHGGIEAAVGIAPDEQTDMLTESSQVRLPHRDKRMESLSICVDEFKVSLLALSCMCPGIATMVYNLVASDPDDHDESTNDDEDSLVSDTGDLTVRSMQPRLSDSNSRPSGMRRTRSLLPQQVADPWREEYSAGASYEVYRVALSVAFEGVPFLSAASAVYFQTGSLLFALEMTLRPPGVTRLVVNPGNYVIPNVDDYSIYGFVIAEDKDKAEIMSRQMDGSDWQRRRQSLLRAEEDEDDVTGCCPSCCPRAKGAPGLVVPESTTTMENLETFESSLPNASTSGAYNERSRIRAALRALAVSQRAGFSSVNGMPGTREPFSGTGLCKSSHPASTTEYSRPDSDMTDDRADSLDGLASGRDKLRNPQTSSSSYGQKRLAPARVGWCKSGSAPVLVGQSLPRKLSPALIGVLQRAGSLGVIPINEPHSDSDDDGDEYPRRRHDGRNKGNPGDSGERRGTGNDDDGDHDSGIVVGAPGTSHEAAATADATAAAVAVAAATPADTTDGDDDDGDDDDGDDDDGDDDTTEDSGEFASLAKKNSIGVLRRRDSSLLTPGDRVMESVEAISKARGEPVDGHILVLSRNDFSDLIFFAQPLRAAHIKNQHTIVILTPRAPTGNQWANLVGFDDVWVITGNPMKNEDLARAGVFCASTAVLIQSIQDLPDDRAASSIVDADAICIYRLVRSMSPCTRVIIELTKETNIAYLDSGSQEIPLLCPAFVSGQVLSSSVLDIALCQAYYNPFIIQLVEQLVAGPDLGAIVAWEGIEQVGLDPPKDSFVFLKPIPSWVDTYEQLFATLVQNEMLPLGLLRVARAHKRRGDQSEFSYVYTNPSRSVALRSTDQVFLLAMSEPDLETIERVDASVDLPFSPTEHAGPGSNVSGRSGGASYFWRRRA